MLSDHRRQERIKGHLLQMLNIVLLVSAPISAILLFDTRQSTKQAQRGLFTDRKTKKIHY